MGFLTYPTSSAAKLPEYLSEQATRDIMIDSLLDGLFTQVGEHRVPWPDYITDDVETLSYRKACLMELRDNPELVEKLRALSDALGEIRTLLESNEGESLGDKLRDFSIMQITHNAMTELYLCLFALIEQNKLHATALLTLADILRDKLETNFPKRFEEEWAKKSTGLAQLGSLLFRFSLNDELRVEGVSLISANYDAYRKKEHNVSAPHGMLTPATELVSTQTKFAHRALLQSLRALLNDLEELHLDLLFYLAALSYIDKACDIGLPLCYATCASPEKKLFTAKALRNPVLAFLKNEIPVESDIAFAEGGEILILTGINQGGKTTFLRAVASTQILFQLGWPVPCESAELSPVDRIVTVFSHEENTGLMHGKLGQELRTIRAGLDAATPHCLLLCNEPVTGTSPMENLYLSREILVSCKLSGYHGVWVTHLYDLADEAPAMNEELSGSTLSSIIAVANQTEDGASASYRIVRGKPQFTSFAKEVLEKNIRKE